MEKSRDIAAFLCLHTIVHMKLAPKKKKEKETGTTNSGRMMDYSNKWYCKWLSV